jgi:hypothetical protein
MEQSVQTGRKSRLFFVDNLRVGLIALVVAHHAGQAYGPTGGWWYYVEPAKASMLASRSPLVWSVQKVG